MRMLGGHKDNFLLKITNTFGRNHAYKSSSIKKYDEQKISRPREYISDEGYMVYRYDYTLGIDEGRITEEYIEEMRSILDKVMFGILYECVYPPTNLVEEGDWFPLITPELIEESQSRNVIPTGIKRLGLDFAEGGNFNAFVVRYDNYAALLDKDTEPDLMKTANKVISKSREGMINDRDTFGDATGVGAGVISRLHQLNFKINGIKSGSKPAEKTAAQKLENPIEFSNLRAEINWKAKEWLEQGGALEPNGDWSQATKMRYRTEGDKKIKIMSKEMMRARGLLTQSESPDVWDGFTLTFAPKEKIALANVAQSVPINKFYPEIGI
jgi:hypothetical protein